jgi:hypothetical protein
MKSKSSFQYQDQPDPVAKTKAVKGKPFKSKPVGRKK